jgi:uncharacterized protein (DUF2249 family)
MNPAQPTEEIILDVRGLEAPEPLEQVLDALASLPRHQHLRMLIDREPRPLYPILENNGFRYETHTSAEFRYEIVIWHRD